MPGVAINLPLNQVQLSNGPLGAIRFHFEGDSLTALHLLDGPPKPPERGASTYANAQLLPSWCAQALDDFLAARPLEVLQLQTQGSPFQERVWEILGTIRVGETLSYGAVAKRLGSSGAARAVGGACNRNPIPLFIPCHRVVGTQGLGGFAFGLTWKEALLDREQKLENSQGRLTF